MACCSAYIVDLEQLLTTGWSIQKIVNIVLLCFCLFLINRQTEYFWRFY